MYVETQTLSVSGFPFPPRDRMGTSGSSLGPLILSDDASPSPANEGGPGGGELPFGLCNGVLKVQKVYRGYRTRRKLADSAVLAEELWWQVMDYARLNHSTVSFFNFDKPETAASRWQRVLINASKVGQGLSKDAKAQKLAFQHWIEAIDPRHRYGHNLHAYYETWSKSDSEQPFFYWLDIGVGRDIDLKDCPRSKLRQQCIKYLGPQEREHYEYIITEGKIVHKQSGELLDTYKGCHKAKWIFVVSTLQKLYAGKKKKGAFHHSSFLAGGATLAAGRLSVEKGVLKTISPYSGHYRPTNESLASFLSFLKDNGVNLDEVEISKVTEDSDLYKDNDSSTEKREAKGLDRSLSIDSKLPLNKEEEEEEEVEEEKASLGDRNGTEKTEDTRQALIRRLRSNKTAVFNDTQKLEPQLSRKWSALSGGVPSPRADVPKDAILQRINSKKATRSYQLGHQLSRKWSTGAGPRIGCVNDYPAEVRHQALEIVNLSPRLLPTTPPGSFCQMQGIAAATFPPGIL